MFRCLVLVCAFGLLGFSDGQVVQSGQCNTNIAVEDDFDVEQFTGQWFEVARTNSEYQSGDCSRYEFSGSNGTLAVSNFAMNRNFAEAANGTATYGTDPARMVLSLSSFPNTMDYWILSTDYDNYALAYSCENVDSTTRAVYLWKLGRATSYPSELMAALMDMTILNLFDITASEALYDLDHSENACFELPVIEEGQPIILPGVCDANITLVQNFDAARFLGRWHEVSSYFSENALGTCPNAYYSLNDEGSVAVTNSQVINQTLLTISGSAVVTNPDGILSVTLEVAPGVFAEQELWILATDYDSYAISYTCSNIGTTERRVYAWILSRDRLPSAETSNNIAQIVGSILDLNDNYFIQADQSDPSCFYFPEPADEQPVVFPGRCDQNIPTVVNFDAVGYMGLWHEIEGYPSTFQQGTCNNALYTLNTDEGIVEVYNTQVINQTLDYVNGVAVVTSDDGTAQLEVTFPVAGVPNFNVSTNYWVLATDYNTYALVYSCQDLPEDRRAVFSWKLSRSKNLAAAASIAMDNVISTIDVLDPRYYVNKDQSVEGCFYYPEPVLGQPVVFPGQCDDTVAAVPNFNLEQFAGAWNQIEAYPSVLLAGQCVDHEFTQLTDNTVNWVSNQINDQFLSTVNGSVAFTSTDGSGRLSVTFESNGEEITIPYWILSTDYNSYAFAYSCVNLNPDFRGIWSWKLSRSTTFSAAATTAIDNVISSNVVLDNAYFEQVDQSADACFYLPDLDEGEPVILPGQCEDVPVVQNFDAERYMGTWRLIESYPSEFETGECNDATYTLENGTVIVYNTQVSEEQLEYIYGSAVLASNDGSALLDVTFPVAGSDMTVSQEYRVLATDYDSYSLVYSCTNITPDTRRVWSWKMSRTATLTDTANAAIDEVINSINVLNNRFYVARNHSDAACFYYPEPSDSPVLFRGQCDMNIPAFANFDAARYMGLWHEIESYPSTFQSGTCNNARYTLVDGSVEVYNTQVINQTLDDINGVAVIDTDDGSAKLSVTFPVIGTNLTVTTSYWVLDTDYDNYALVYTCENIGENQRAVFSWKLSRTKSLTASASTAINSVVSTIQVLDQRYFTAADQTEEGCFYFPEPVAGQPVIFPGFCNNPIYAVSNFSLDLFSGLWYEVAAYPKTEVENSDCHSYDFSVTSDNSFNLISNQVLGLSLQSTNATVVRVTNDESAMLEITLDVDGTEIIIPYWILRTDYTSYALAFSCIELPDDMRAVYSWKLSRSKELSLESQELIADEMSSVQVLDERYFEDTDQSDDACFYLPDITLEEPVIFVGQCDENLPTVQNFDAARYTGQWYDIASYYDAFQSGTCNDALYTLNPSGVVDVYNTQVVNQTLDTITGTAVVASTDGSGRLEVTFPIAGTDFTVTSSYWILDTDYDSYSLVYSCVNLNSDTRRVYSWKLSRTRALDSAASAAIDVVVSTVPVLDDRYYITRSHSEDDCFYYPEHDSNTPVVFRGQCDPNVAVVQNFDVVAYTGLWYDVGSYPQEFQNGTCPTATYTLNDAGSVDVYNTQVVNQQLGDISGTASLASNDGSARLTVTFPIAGTDLTISSPYWVLATDYTDYALVYSCTNIGPERYRVSSWKLSRQPILSPASETAISNIISDVRVLAEQYYENRGHSEEECFFYPDNQGGPVILDGLCDSNQDTVTNFDINSFAGAWYEAARFPSELQTGSCAASDISIVNNNIVISQSIIYNERQTTVPGTIVANNDGVLTVTLNLPDGGTETLTVYVLDTDYTDYALLFSCRNINATQKQVYSWQLSRSRSGLSSDAIANINSIVADNIDLFSLYYEETDQSLSACFYYPEFDDDVSSIELPGPCNDTIQAMPNFNVAGYLGRWFEVARYPQVFEVGQCARATYTASEGAVDVRNELVNNQTLEIVVGSAVVASTDGSGLLDVTFELEGGIVNSANYYVLDTDYDNYALVYSCRNLENGNRQVSSWKLSRERTLSSEASAIIDPIIDSTQGLLEDYYSETSQTDEDCFYVPEVADGEDVIFRGQCEDISGVQGFNMQQFLGWWHEIESYPRSTSIGDCVSAQFEAVGSSFVAVDTGVFGLDAVVNASTLTVTEDGRLRRTFSDGRISDIWVLATDYDNYALLYTCENIDDEYRRVLSAKHSKVRSLTPAAQEAMAAIIESNQVLRSEIYRPVDQSDAACFHYPAQSGQQIVLPGQCDSNIPVQQNFDAVQYTGTWYEIERYPQAFQSGTCIGARYSLNEDTGLVNVLNWEVVDGVLLSLEGNATISSTDGSGQLLVTLPIPGTEITATTELYVLTTDYISYSLVYSCVNINDFQRIVASWKLSRTRTMPSSGSTAINAYMNEREELHQPYFVSTVQNEDCEEPNSSFMFKSSVAIMFACVLLQFVML